MRMTKKAALAAAMLACAAAPAANATEMCAALKSAIKVGATDKAFTSLQAKPYGHGGDEGVLSTLQIDNFVCKISTEEGRGYFACIRDQAATGLTEAAALSPGIGKCLGVTATVDKADYSTSYTYVVRAEPRLIVYMSGTQGKLLFVNVVAR